MFSEQSVPYQTSFYQYIVIYKNKGGTVIQEISKANMEIIGCPIVLDALLPVVQSVSHLVTILVVHGQLNEKHE